MRLGIIKRLKCGYEQNSIALLLLVNPESFLGKKSQEVKVILSNTFGKIFRITTWGESHGKAIGVVIDGCPAGLRLSEKDIQKELDRRRPGQSKISTSRREEDKAEILSGLFEGKTLGTPISIIIRNKDARSGDYQRLKDVYRPGHADFTYEAKYGIRDWRGGGRASGRETVGRVAGGAVGRKILASAGVEIVGFVKQIGDIKLKTQNSRPPAPTCPRVYARRRGLWRAGKTTTQNSKLFREEIESSMVRCPNEKISAEMIKLTEKVRKEGDSVGGVVEIIAVGVPVGWGEPVFDKLSADLAKGLMSIPGVKGVEIGSGFDCCEMRGSEHNDVFYATPACATTAAGRHGRGSGEVGTSNHKASTMPARRNGNAGGGRVETKTNHAGGILGGISNGMPIVARIAVKPTSSIAKEQKTVDKAGRSVKIKITGRHDPCLCPRVVPVAEAMMALVLVDYYLISRMYK